MEIFVARVNYGQPSLTRATVKETKKTYVIVSKEVTYGECLYSRRIHKDDAGVFSSFSEAAQYLIREMERYIQKHENDIRHARARIDDLRELEEIANET